MQGTANNMRKACHKQDPFRRYLYRTLQPNSSKSVQGSESAACTRTHAHALSLLSLPSLVFWKLQEILGRTNDAPFPSPASPWMYQLVKLINLISSLNAQKVCYGLLAFLCTTGTTQSASYVNGQSAAMSWNRPLSSTGPGRLLYVKNGREHKRATIYCRGITLSTRTETVKCL